MNSTTRRDFTRAAITGAMALRSGKSAAPAKRPTLCLFSKHLPKLDYAELATTVKKMGFDGVDLTVRQGGHVLPERAAEDLPRAVDRIRAEGLTVPMITTGLISPSDPAARPTLITAGKLKIPFYKLGYWHYPDATAIDARIGEVRRDVAGLVDIAKEHGVVTGFHNHSGNYVGAAIWDIRAIIGDMDPRWAGHYFDPCHATVEGGDGGWLIALRMALARIKMVAIKDFQWEKRDAKWKARMCPLGEGMVDWPKFFSLLAAARFTGPVSLHMEYEPADEMAAIVKDFEFLRKQVDGAYRALS